MPFWNWNSDPNTPRKGFNRGDDKPVLDGATGDAGRDGYTRLSQADRASGYRRPIGTEPDYGRSPIE